MPEIKETTVRADHSLSDWIAKELAEPQPERFLESVCRRISEAGVPIGRCALLIRTPHPTLMGRTFIWQRDEQTRDKGQPGEEVSVTFAPTAARHGDRFLLSPVFAVFENGETVRRRICDGEGIGEFGLIDDLAKQGATDYLAYPLPFLDGENHVLTWTCYTPGGFSDADIALLLSIRIPIARTAQIYALQWTAENLLSAYLGAGTGTEIMNGRHHLGDSERIHAVVSFLDLRGSVRLAEQYGTDRFLIELNRFFALTAQPVQEAGGEILRYIGDAFLAIFPIAKFGDERSACRTALEAAQKAAGALEAENAVRGTTGDPPFECGIGLHIGEVLYGNIGTTERLEFTVIGATANEAARIESQCRDLGEPILVSRDFARHCPQNWRNLGRFSLKNVSREMTLMAP